MTGTAGSCANCMPYLRRDILRLPNYARNFRSSNYNLAVVDTADRKVNKSSGTLVLEEASADASSIGLSLAWPQNANLDRLLDATHGMDPQLLAECAIFVWDIV